MLHSVAGLVGVTDASPDGIRRDPDGSRSGQVGGDELQPCTPPSRIEKEPLRHQIPVSTERSDVVVVHRKHNHREPERHRRPAE